MNYLRHRWTLRLLAWAIAVTLIWAGSVKLLEPISFADSISTFELLPPVLINPVALFLPPLELLAAGLLIFESTRRLGAFSTTVLAAVFALALLQGLLRQLPLDCGCFGGGEPSTVKTVLSLLRDGVLFMAALWIYRCSRAAPAAAKAVA